MNIYHKLIVWLVICIATPVALLFAETGQYNVELIDDQVVTVANGIKLEANVYIPVSYKESSRGSLPEDAVFPAIVISSGLSADKDQMAAGAEFLAEAGYIVARYSPRGNAGSEGENNMFGADAIDDFSYIIDWVMDIAPVDDEKIGAAGLSSGGAISFIGGAGDERIKAVGMMSMGFDLCDAFFGANATRITISEIILATCYLNGDIDDEMEAVLLGLILNDDIDTAEPFFQPRSPKSYIDAINARNLPVFISLNMQDPLYWPNQGLAYFNRITSPKYLMFSDGSHATAEFDDTTKDEIWGNLLKWFDQFLNDKATGITNGDTISMPVTGTDERITFDAWPPTESSVNQIEDVTYYLKPGIFWRHGTMTPDMSTSFKIDLIYSGSYSGLLSSPDTNIQTLTSLFGINDSLFQSRWIPGINKSAAVLYQSETFKKDRIMAGIPTLRLQVESIVNEIQLIAHIYDVDAFGIGSLITYAPIRVRNMKPGVTTTIFMEFFGVSYPVPKGHRLALAIDTKDNQFDRPTDYLYPVLFRYNEAPTLNIQFLAE